MAIVAAHQPGEHPKSKSTQPRFASRCVTLYRAPRLAEPEYFLANRQLIKSFLIFKDFDASHDSEWQKIMNGLDLDGATSNSSEEDSAAAAEDVSPEFCDFLPERGPCHGRWTRCDT